MATGTVGSPEALRVGRAEKNPPGTKRGDRAHPELSGEKLGESTINIGSSSLRRLTTRRYMNYINCVCWFVTLMIQQVV